MTKGELVLSVNFSVQCVGCDAKESGVLPWKGNMPGASEFLRSKGWYFTNSHRGLRRTWRCPACIAAQFGKADEEKKELEALERRVAKLREEDKMSWRNIASEMNMSEHIAFDLYGKSIQLRIGLGEETKASIEKKRDAAIAANANRDRSRRVTKEVLEEIVRLRCEEDLSETAISEKTGVCRATVHRTLVKASEEELK